MQKTQTYRRAIFEVSTIRAAIDKMRKLNEDVEWDAPTRSVLRGDEKWYLDDDEEFFAEYSRSVEFAYYGLGSRTDNRKLDVFVHNRDSNPSTEVTVQAGRRADIESVMNVFSEHFQEAVIPEPPEMSVPRRIPPPNIFIGHGRSDQWRQLKDHLQDQHEYKVEAYESGARAGHAVRDILDELMQSASFAILVMTGEDETADGALRARQNVVHETGLFQGRLGFSRAVVLEEEGVETFSNLAGIQTIRFSKDRIRETFGDVLGVLHREFGATH